MTNLRHRQVCRRVMVLAWIIDAAAKTQGRSESRAYCLRAAWRMEQEGAAYAAGLRAPGRVMMSPSLIRSPLKARFGAGSHDDFKAAYVTAVIGG